MWWTNHPKCYHCPPLSHSASSAKKSDWILVNEQSFWSIQNRNRCHAHCAHYKEGLVVSWGKCGLTVKMPLSKCQPLSFFFILGKRLWSEPTQVNRAAVGWVQIHIPGGQPSSLKICGLEGCVEEVLILPASHAKSFVFFNSCLKRSACSARVIL